MIRQSRKEFEAIVNQLNVNQTFVICTPKYISKYQICSIIPNTYGRITVVFKGTGFDVAMFKRVNYLHELKEKLIHYFIKGEITEITSNPMSLSEFKNELHKLKDGAYLHLWNFKDEVISYKVIMNWDYNALYSVILRDLTKNDTSYDITARNISQVIDTFIDLFKNDTYCRCEVVIPGKSSNTTNESTGIHPIIVITNEDKIDLIQDNSYIRLIEPDETEHEYIVSINPEALYTSQIVSLHDVHNADNNPGYSSLDELKCALRTDIKNGKYSSIEVIQLSPIYNISNYAYITPDKDWVNGCISDEDRAKLSEPLKELNNATESNVYYPYKRYEIIQHKDYGIGIVNDNTFTFNNSRTSASCKFWNSFKWKYLNKYCTQKNISIYYPNITEITKQKLDCFIIFKNVKTFKYLLKYLSAPYLTKEIKKSILNGRYKEQITKKYSIPVIQIRQGEIIDIIYVNNKWFANIKCYDINMSDNTLIDTNTHKYAKEESKMKKIVVNQTMEKRVNKTNNTKYDVITTEVTVGNINGKVTLSAHDKDDTKMAIMYAICNAVVGGNFDTAYDRYLKHKQEEENPIADRTCSYCGTVFNTIQEKEEHEKLEHIEKRKARHERYLIRKEAKRRLAEMEQEKLDAEREKAIEAKMEEMQKAEKKNK